MIDYIKNQFGVSASDLNYQDIVNYFNEEKRENDRLEFKSFDGEKLLPQKIYRSICAMLNSEGGLIIWGAPREIKQDGKKVWNTQLMEVTEKFDVDSIIRSLTDSITPTPKGIQIFPFNDDNKFVYLIQIQKSEYSPHQYDNIYYMRLDGSTVKAPHHYVEALFKQVKYPNLNGYVEFNNIEFADKDGAYIQIELNVFIRNMSKIQNEEFPKCEVLSNVGELLDIEDAWPIPERPLIYGVSRPPIPAPMETLHFGKNRGRRCKLGLNHYDKKNIEIVIMFGGRLSPLKYTHYSIDISFFSNMKYIEMQEYDFPIEHITTIEKDVLLADGEIDTRKLNSWKSMEL